jgi:hypothetical protein
MKERNIPSFPAAKVVKDFELFEKRILPPVFLLCPALK